MLGGWFCLGRALWSRIFPGGVCLPDVIALLVWYHPPGTELPSRFGGDGWIFKGFARIGRVVLSREGENVSLVVVVGMCAWKLWVRGAVLTVVPRVGAGSVKALRGLCYLLCWGVAGRRILPLAQRLRKD